MSKGSQDSVKPVSWQKQNHNYLQTNECLKQKFKYRYSQTIAFGRLHLIKKIATYTQQS